jgi:oxalate decarboxylase
MHLREPKETREKTFGGLESELKIGYVPAVAGHYIEITGNTDALFLEVFKALRFMDFSMNNWIRRMPPEMASAHLNLDAATLRKIPSQKQEIIAG